MLYYKLRCLDGSLALARVSSSSKNPTSQSINWLVLCSPDTHVWPTARTHVRARRSCCYSAPAAACKCNAADPCPSDRVFLCQLLWTVVQFHLQVDLTRDNTYIPFCKVEGFEQLYPRRHRREGRSPGQGFTASLLLSCMLTQLVFFGSCCMPTVIVNYSLQSKT